MSCATIPLCSNTFGYTLPLAFWGDGIVVLLSFLRVTRNCEIVLSAKPLFYIKKVAYVQYHLVKSYIELQQNIDYDL